jgi:nicotinamide-nucleotide amidase
MFPPDFLAAAEAVLGACRARGWQVTTAESCTGGLIAGLLTAIGGSSDVVDGGAVTYSNAAKTRMLGVPAALIAAHGAVSEEVARAMAEGARRTAGVDLAVAVTGVAGRRNGGEAGGSGVVRVGITGRRRHAVAHFPG